MERLLCIRCGDSIHPDTAQRNEGLCVPCVRGNQLTIEQRKEQHRKEREAERAWRESPAWQYWLSLVDRVYKTEGGFDALSKGDRLYYLINSLKGGVLNGGFVQFFSNSSGERCNEIASALAEMGEPSVCVLLEEARRALFGERDVPKDRHERYNLMVTSSEEHPHYQLAIDTLEALDRKFYARVDDIEDLLDRIAVTHNLYAQS